MHGIGFAESYYFKETSYKEGISKMTHLLRIHPIKKEKKYLYGFFLPFTILFLLLSLLLFLYYAHNGMSLIFAGDDYTQHYRAFVYAVQYYRSIIRNVLISHSFSLKTFNFSLGFGADILTTLNYYAIGDPLVLLAVVVPTKYLLGAYYFLIFSGFICPASASPDSVFM